MSTYCSPQWPENGHVYRESEAYPSAANSGYTKTTHNWTQPGLIRSGEQQVTHLHNNSLRRLRSTTEDPNAPITAPLMEDMEGDTSAGSRSPIAAHQPLSSSHLSCKDECSIPQCPDSWNIISTPTPSQRRAVEREGCRNPGDQREGNGSRRSSRKKRERAREETTSSDHDKEGAPMNITTNDCCSWNTTPTYATPTCTGTQPFDGSTVACCRSGDLGTPSGTQTQVISQLQLERIVLEHSYSTPEPSNTLCGCVCPKEDPYLTTKLICKCVYPKRIEPEGIDTPTPPCVKLHVLQPPLASGVVGVAPGVVGVTCKPVQQDSIPPPLLPPVLALPSLLIPLATPTIPVPLATPTLLPPAPTLPSSPVECNLQLDNFSLDLDTEPDSSDDNDDIVGQKALVSSTSSVACSTSSVSTISTRSTAQVGKSPSFPANHIQLRNGRILPSIVSPSKKSKEVLAASSSLELLCESPVSSCESVSDELERSLKLRGRGGPQTHSTRTRGIKGQLKKNDLSLSTRCDHQPSHATRKGSINQQQKISLRRKRKMESNRSSTEEQAKCKVNKKPFKDFQPEILQTRSRAETATLRRRKEMEVEMEQHELERSQSAPPDSSSASNLDTSAEQEELLDCLHSISETTHSSSVMSSSAKDTTESKAEHSVASSKDEFPPELIAQCRKVLPARSSGDTALHKVCRNGKYDMARCLIILEGIDTNSQDHAGWTPLHEAVSAGHMRIAQLLLENGADPNLSATDGTRPLNDAIEIGSLELVKLLIQCGADPTAEFGEKTPLEHAINFERADIIDYLESIVSNRRRSKGKASSLQHPAVVGRKAIRKQRKEVNEEQGPTEQLLPIDGYTLGPSLGPELDCPLFYISPIVEMCEKPLLPIYNLEVTSGRNARKHNFHILHDVLAEVGLESSEQFRELYPHMRTHSMPVEDVLRQLKSSSHNQQLSHQWELHCSFRGANSGSIELVPVCNELRALLGIEVANVDD
eukprot:Em0021g948a